MKECWKLHNTQLKRTDINFGFMACYSLYELLEANLDFLPDLRFTQNLMG